MREDYSNKTLYDFFKRLDRSIFLEGENKEYAHYDNPLPIGFQQTISQPTLVYSITDKLDLNKDLKVLEIGTGSGYQTAFLAEFSGMVYTVERIKELSAKAQKRLKKLGYDNINFKIGDGSEGWAENKPYDRIVVTAAAGSLPDMLIDQLNLGGKMIVPVGKKDMQELLMIQKDERGSIRYENLGKVRFVEMKGKYGWEQ